MSTDVVVKLLQDAEDLKDEKEDLKERTEANRRALRALADAGALTEPQLVTLGEYYPPRKKKETTTKQEDSQ